MVTPGGPISSDGRADTEILPRVYDELRRVAARLMRKERADHTLSPTAVVHEAVIRLLGDQNFHASDCDLLMASASRAMREVLIEHARHRAALAPRWRVASRCARSRRRPSRRSERRRRRSSRGPRPARPVEPAAEPGHHAAVLRRADRAGSGRCPGRLGRHRRTRLARRARLAARPVPLGGADDAGALAADQHAVRRRGRARARRSARLARARPAAMTMSSAARCRLCLDQDASAGS